MSTHRSNKSNNLIPHRKTLSPGMQFYSLGKLENKEDLINHLKIKNHNAQPAEPTELAEGFKKIQGLNVKPET